MPEDNKFQCQTLLEKICSLSETTPFFFDDIIVKIKNIIMVLSLKQVSCVRIAVPYRFIGQVNVE